MGSRFSTWDIKSEGHTRDQRHLLYRFGYPTVDSENKFFEITVRKYTRKGGVKKSFDFKYKIEDAERISLEF